MRMLLGWVVYNVLRVKTVWLCFGEALLLGSQKHYTVKSVHSDRFKPLRTKFGFSNSAKVKLSSLSLCIM